MHSFNLHLDLVVKGFLKNELTVAMLNIQNITFLIGLEAFPIYGRHIEEVFFKNKFIDV